TPAGPDQNLTVSRFGGYYFTRYDTKIDHQFNAAHRIFGRYSQLRERSPGRESAELTGRVFDASIQVPIDIRNIVLSDTYNLNPTTINELRVASAGATAPGCRRVTARISRSSLACPT